MAFTGKQYSAVIVRTSTGGVPSQPDAYEYKLYWTDIDWGRPDQIAAYYPDLVWDEDVRVTASTINQSVGGSPITSWLSTNGYADAEAAMLDKQNYIENVVSAAHGDLSSMQGPSFYIRYRSGAWRTDDIYSGDPDSIWAAFPDANTYNVLTPTSFGSYGNGVIHHQALYWKYVGELGNTLTPQPFTTTEPAESPGTDSPYKLRVESIDLFYIFTPIDNGSGDTGDTGEGTDTGGDVPSGGTGVPVTNAWGFSLDDHDFYVLPSIGIVYDLKTNQWSEWKNEGLTRLRACVGQNWVGMTTSLSTFGADIVAGDDTTGDVWVFDPTVALDDRTDESTETFERIVTSMVALNGRETLPCNAVQLVCALGNPAQAGCSITLETSDDRGQTWVNHGAIELVADTFDQVVEWRGLGVIREPGRIFRFTDDGATVSYLRAEMR